MRHLEKEYCSMSNFILSSITVKIVLFKNLQNFLKLYSHEGALKCFLTQRPLHFVTALATTVSQNFSTNTSITNFPDVLYELKFVGFKFGCTVVTFLYRENAMSKFFLNIYFVSILLFQLKTFKVK